MQTYRYVYRSSITGQIVPEWYALRYPHLTYRDKVPTPSFAKQVRALRYAIKKTH